MQSNVEYLTVLFDGPPSGDQLSKQFGKDGWVLAAMLPVFLPVEKEGDPPVQRLQGYFCRNSSPIMVPVR